MQHLLPFNTKMLLLLLKAKAAATVVNLFCRKLLLANNAIQFQLKNMNMNAYDDE